MQEKAFLILEDGKTFSGYSFGAPGSCFGEIVFNTGMAGYQEIITDPSYKGQIVTLTYPLIGNYGVNPEDTESRKVFTEGLVVKEYSKIRSNWRSSESLGDYLKRYNICAIEGVDTRAVTLHIRQAGAMMAGLFCAEDALLSKEEMLQKIKSAPGLVGRDLVKVVSITKKYTWSPKKKAKWRAVVLDCGVKYNTLRHLLNCGCEVIVVPVNTSYEEILSYKPHGLLLSNGPGDPAAVANVVETTRMLIGRLPIFGICLGHQMLGRAFGGKTFKLKFGHHGVNHPVKDLKSGKIAITSQNHGFCVDIDSLNKKEIELTHVNLNDQTLEGMRHKKLPIFSVQFHPEAGPGPNDAAYLFDEFVGLMKKHK